MTHHTNIKRFLPIFFFFFPVLLSAQTAAEIDALLETGALTYAQASRFILAAADIVSPETSADEAFRTAQVSRSLPRGAVSGAPATLGGTALLVMKSFGIKGGLFYTIFPGARYAYREMVYKKLIQGRSDPSMAVSGERLLRIISRALVYIKQDDALALVPRSQPETEAEKDGVSAAADALPDARGLSTGSEGVLEYEGKFEIE
ncbi:MAG: hypothetical protein LBD71_02725 [Treponema sp.]|jgi:hypothetical protein|nr:hypothetical protein [Treponema sp.]